MVKSAAVKYNTKIVPTLYVIATPIGNLEDISIRALRYLRDVKLIAAEDTRSTRHLLNAYNIKNTITSYHEHSKKAKRDYLLSRLKDDDVALVSEAGTPGLSDPGYKLIADAIEHGIPVVPIPGASAVITALVVSGLPTDQFVYLGFVPRRHGQRRRVISSVADEPRTIVAFEAPHRLRETLSAILEILGDRQLAVCRELTKTYEEVFRGTVSQAMEHFIEPKGECTLVIEGKSEKVAEISAEVKRELREYYKQGISAKESVSQVSKASGLPKRKLYQSWLNLKKGG